MKRRKERSEMRKQLAKRRRIKHAMQAGSVLAGLLAAGVFLLGTLGGAGYVEKGGSLDTGLQIVLISLACVAALVFVCVALWED